MRSSRLCVHSRRCEPLHAGVNIKADVSMWLACFLGSLATLGLLHGAYGLLVALCLLDPKLYR